MKHGMKKKETGNKTYNFAEDRSLMSNGSTQIQLPPPLSTGGRREMTDLQGISNHLQKTPNRREPELG